MTLTTISNCSLSILGLAGNRDLDASCLKKAFAAGINYFFFYELSAIENLADTLKNILAKERANIAIATGSESRDLNQLQIYLDATRQRLGIKVIDVFFLEYVSPAEDIERVETLLEELTAWKERGWIRYLGISTHNRPIALRAVESGKIDILMHRYNLAHRKAESEVFPAAFAAKTPVVAFTCTRWGTLLQGHSNWRDRIPTAADCYRFALTDRAIALVLTSPKNLRELSENLQVFQRPQLTETEIKLWKNYGALIYGKGQDSFETKWL